MPSMIRRPSFPGRLAAFGLPLLLTLALVLVLRTDDALLRTLARLFVGRPPADLAPTL